MSERQHWSDKSLTGCFQKESSTEIYGIGLSHGREVIFNSDKAMLAFIDEFSEFMKKPPFDEIDNYTKKEAEDPKLYIQRISRSIPTALDIFAFSKFSRLSTNYWMGAVKRESFFDPENDAPKAGTYGPLQIQEAYFTDAIKHVKDPFCLFGDYIKRALDPDIPMEQKLMDTRDPLWAAALKDGYGEYYMARLKLPPDERSFYLLHLGPGHARRMAHALAHTPDKPVNKIFGESAYDPDNKALMIKDDGKFKTAREFWNDLSSPELGIPSGPIADKAPWTLEYAQIRHALPSDEIGIEKPLEGAARVAALEATEHGHEIKTTALPLTPGTK